MLEADFASHHIEGYARMAMEAGLDGYFKVPLISEVLPGLWQGGCRNGVELSGFDLVVALYQGERYRRGRGVNRHDFHAYDASEVPDLSAAVALAHAEWKAGKRVLIHCQAGLNRSGLVAAQVLMREGYAPSEAIALLRDKRCPLVPCNQAFERWLMEQEA